MDDETLRRLVRARMHDVPATRRDCPSPEALQSAATAPSGDASQFAVVEHVTTCAPCRRDFDLLRTAHAAAPPARQVTIPRWIPALAAAAVIAVVSIVALDGTDDAVRGDGERAQPTVELLPPTQRANGLTLRWHSVPEAVTYRVEVTDDAGTVAFSTETPDTTVVAPVPRDAALRWSVEARLLDGSVRTSKLDALPTAP
ncbi:MAG: hypothetical protein U5K74_12415 [Gemmatimonadaceae bacterium]|nr:hypothetical protein [Gemmatimonadaceae bacterium]